MSIRYDSSSYVGEVDYDPTMIQQFADKMYFQARVVICLYALVGAAAGCVGLAAAASEPKRIPFAAAGAVIGGILGYFAAQPRAFQLRLLAQTALCQMKIEANTRARLETARLA